MNQKKTFNCYTQRMEDAIKAVATLMPAVALLQTLDCKEKERDPIAKVVNDYINDIGVISQAASKLLSKNMRSDVGYTCEKCVSYLEEAKELLEGHDQQLSNLEKEMYEYLEYTNSFFYVGEEDIAEKLLYQATEQKASKEKFFATLLLLLNANVEDPNAIVEAANKVAKETNDEFKRHILMNMERLKQNDICRFIRESE